ncbi:PQQ-binding-like beta-propeller repeat protein [Flavobacterium enshiense]|nr:PQQ-binding-like beta-propeller repeat protein [Flavobacterium enshiense]
MRHLFLLMFFLMGFNSKAQTEFFASKISFSERNLSDFYSSIAVDSSQVYFNANDYRLYAFDKKSGNENWQFYLANKSNKAPFIYKQTVLANEHVSQYSDKSSQLDSKTGIAIQELKIDEILTTPLFKDSIMYCTGLYEGGAIIAYNLNKNEVLWSRFIAHGSSIRPYYLKDKIIVNAEGDNWFELDYDGKLIDNSCKYKSTFNDGSEVCAKNFKRLTHNQKELSENYFNNDDNVDIKYGKDKTILLSGNELIFINNRNKVSKKVDLDQTLEFPEGSDAYNEYKSIVKADDNVVWVFYQNLLAVYDLKKNAIIQTIDLTKWNPHRLVADKNDLWLVSRNDGQLYGIHIN